LFKEEWFKNKDILDVGCHEGYIAITLGKIVFYKPIL
jgi:16S rRNA G1207 methylase RsmC